MKNKKFCKRTCILQMLNDPCGYPACCVNRAAMYLKQFLREDYPNYYKTIENLTVAESYKQIKEFLENNKYDIQSN